MTASRTNIFIPAAILTLFLLVISIQAKAQDQQTVSGTITDASTGETLPGVNILVKGTSSGTASGNSGNYELSVPSLQDTLVFSFVGYQKLEEPINGRTQINVSLGTQTLVGEEMVVVGYGSQQKSDIVGSVSSVDVTEATAIPTTNVSEMLRGKAAGVQINLNDPRPGGNSDILIRGQVSLVGNDPLIIVDGVPYDDIDDIPPTDIKSVEVLKDAASQAIYGARAANGVILITTKRGQEGSFKIDYHGYRTTQTLTKNFDLYSAQEFAQLRREAQRTTNNGEYLDDEVIFEDFELQSLANEDFVDWQDLVLENAVINSHSVNVSGGSEKTRVYTSFNYFDQGGLIPTSGFERGSFRVNLDQEITDKLKLQANINLQTSSQDIETGNLNFINISPLARPFDEEGNLIREPLGGSTTRVNPLWNIREATNEVTTNLYDLNFVGVYNFMPTLSYEFNTFYRNRDGEQGIYQSSLHPAGDSGVDGIATLGTNSYNEFLIENIVNYSPQITNDHQLDLTFVQSVNERRTTESSVVKSGFPNDELGFDGNATELRNSTRDASRRRLVSFLGRARYNFMEKYLLTLTARADGSSVFAENNKWGIFPAAAIAWKMQEEPFLQRVSAINQMKIRLSYGQTGNEGINPNESLGLANDLPYVFGGVTAGGFAPLNRLPNPNLKWETSTTFNAGIDFGLIENRFSGSLEYYNTQTTDFLLDRLLSGVSGFSVTRFNIGEVENKGFEATLNADIIRGQDFQWSAGLTYSRNNNKITKLAGEVDSEGNPIDFVSQGLYIGESINSINQKIFDGIWQEGDDIANSAQSEAMPGDIRVVDVNGDGDITDDDNVVFDQDPDWYGSVNSTLQFKGFELYADLYIVQGATRTNPYLSTFENGGTLQGVLNGIKVDYYLPEDPSNEFPRPRAQTPSFLFALAVKDASYIRLRTLTLSYNIPQDALSRVGLSNAEVYATGTNVFTITDYKSYSPEVNPGSFPDAKGLTFGVKLGF
jgi:TonB-linked SusC/RagA family outer membrane protein